MRSWLGEGELGLVWTSRLLSRQGAEDLTSGQGLEKGILKGRMWRPDYSPAMTSWCRSSLSSL